MIKRFLTIILINCSAFYSFAQTAEILLPENEFPKLEFTVNGMGVAQPFITTLLFPVPQTRILLSGILRFPIGLEEEAVWVLLSILISIGVFPQAWRLFGTGLNSKLRMA